MTWPGEMAWIATTVAAWLFEFYVDKTKNKISQLSTIYYLRLSIKNNIMQNKKACHPSTLARKATRTIRSKIFLSSF